MGQKQSSLQEEPEPGDLIEFPRGVYSHWGVCVGDRKVVHVTMPDEASGSSSSSFFSSRGKNGVVKKERLTKIVGNGKYKINNKNDQKYKPKPVEEIVCDAEAMVGKQVNYNALQNNCEHFATKLRYGVAESEQGDAVLEALVRKHVGWQESDKYLNI